MAQWQSTGLACIKPRVWSTAPGEKVNPKSGKITIQFSSGLNDNLLSFDTMIL